MPRRRNDVYLMFDIECSGTRLGYHDLIQFGAVAVFGPNLEEREEFPIWQPAPNISINLIQPHFGNEPDPEAMKVNGLDWKEVLQHGEAVESFLQRFVDWCNDIRERANAEKVVLCGHGVVFDWSFLKLIFDAHREDWPCHYSALDLKSFYGGTAGLDFLDCSMTNMREEFRMGQNTNAHDAQADADYQLELLFRSFIKSGMIPRSYDRLEENA